VLAVASIGSVAYTRARAAFIAGRDERARIAARRSAFVHLEAAMPILKHSAVATILTVITIALLGAAHGADAATRTWTAGGTTPNWSDAGNWDTGVPQNGDGLIFPATGDPVATANDLASLHVASIAVQGGAYSIDGSAFLLNAGGIQVAANGNLTVQVAVQLEADATIVVGSDASYHGVQLDNGGHTLTLDAGDRAVINTSPIVGAGGLVKNGVGEADLANNTYIGNTTVNQGTVLCGASPFPNPILLATTTIQAGATLFLTQSVGGNFVFNGSGVNGQGAVVAAGPPGAMLDINGNITLATDTTFAVGSNQTLSLIVFLGLGPVCPTSPVPPG
jgi:autotransporter-associated beta strand protein